MWEGKWETDGGRAHLCQAAALQGDWDELKLFNPEAAVPLWVWPALVVWIGIGEGGWQAGSEQA